MSGINEQYDFWTPESEQVSRTRGFENVAEMQAQMDAKVAIAGVGGAGYPLGLNLARKGVQRFIVTDPDTVELSNFNRLPGAVVENIGVNKAEAFKKDVLSINPSADVEILYGGITADNAIDFVDGSDVVFDGVDFNLPHIAIALHRAARVANIPSVTGLEVGPSAMVTSFDASSISFDEMMGYKTTDTIEQIAEKAINGPNIASSVPYIPYKSAHIDALKSVQDGGALPTTVEGVALFSALAGRQIFYHLVRDIGNNRPLPVMADNFAVHDLDRNFAGVVKMSPKRFTYYAGLLALRSKFNQNPVPGLE